MYMIAVQGVGGGGTNRLCYRVMYRTPVGRVWEGTVIPSHGGDFGNLGTKNLVLRCIIHFKLT